MIGKRNFAFYLAVLLVGTIMQKTGLTLLLGLSHEMAIIWYEACAIVICVSMIGFVLKEYLGQEITQERRFRILMVTSMLGIGLKVLNAGANEMHVWNLGLVFHMTLAVISASYLIANKLESIRRDGGILLSILLTSILYLIAYNVLIISNPIFYITWAVILLLQVTAWLGLGLFQLYHNYSVNRS